MCATAKRGQSLEKWLVPLQIKIKSHLFMQPLIFDYIIQEMPYHAHVLSLLVELGLTIGLGWS